MPRSVFPQPKSYKSRSKQLSRQDRPWVQLTSPHSENFTEALQRFATAHNLSFSYGALPPEQVLIRLKVSSGFRPEAYEISTSEAGYDLCAGNECGLFRGLSTLNQLLTGKTVPFVSIKDEPDLANRGVMLDISRCKVPNIDTLKVLIEQFAQAKFNQLQLYTEHTFAFSRHQTVWADASPLTASEILELKHFAAARYIELVPNLNCFGHFERWLRHPAYHKFAECPDGFIHPLSGAEMPHGSTLNPNKQSLRLVDDLHSEYLPLFDSPYFNIGGDEPWELGLGRSKKRCNAKGTTNVYIDFLSDIQKLTEKRGRQMMFWSDIVLKDPASLKRLSKQLIALNWGYEGNHPFKKESELVAAQKIPFYVCPGTSSWNSLTGRTENMRKNIKSAAKHGFEQGAQGLLVTDWGDHGHHQYLPTSYPGFAVAACESWRVGSVKTGDLPDLVNRLFLAEHTNDTAEHILELGKVLELAKSPLRNATIFNRLLFWKMAHEPSATEQIDHKQLIDCEQALRNLKQRPASANPLINEELQNATLMARHGVERLLYFRGTKGYSNPQSLDRLRADMRQIQAQHQKLWLARNRIGGLTESLDHLEAAETALYPD